MPLALLGHRRIPSRRWLRAVAEELLTAVEHSDETLSLWMCGDDDMRRLNGRWRGKDRPTDVLSFPTAASPAQGSVLGDLVVSVDTARRQAASYGWPVEVEVARLLVHGVLHLLGHDHVHGGRQAARMRREERRLWRCIVPLLGVGAPRRFPE